MTLKTTKLRNAISFALAAGTIVGTGTAFAQDAAPATDTAELDRIEVTGYTDPEGSDAYNLALSRDRANTVKQALLESKLPASAISAHGKGEQDLVVTDCRARFPKNRAQLNLCNQPNRRVEIVLFGANAVSK